MRDVAHQHRGQVVEVRIGVVSRDADTLRDQRVFGAEVIVVDRCRRRIARRCDVIVTTVGGLLRTARRWPDR